jgi:hypothetical protein
MAEAMPLTAAAGPTGLVKASGMARIEEGFDLPGKGIP